jgi:hypothetical protein
VIDLDLYEELLCKEIGRQMLDALKILRIDYRGAVNLKAVEALEKIKTIIENDSLEDDACFTRIEAVVRALEDAGSAGGGRHDFG